MNSIRDQLLSEDWKYWKRAYLDENIGKGCFTCGSEDKLDLYVRKFDHEIEFVWDYPHSAFGIACFECRKTKMKRVDEVKLRLGTWSNNEIDSLLDALDNIEKHEGGRTSALDKLYAYSKRL